MLTLKCHRLSTDIAGFQASQMNRYRRYAQVAAQVARKKDQTAEFAELAKAYSQVEFA